MVKYMKLNRPMQRNLLILTVITTVLVIGLFNLFWEPMLFLIVMSYIIMNKNQAITKNEWLLAVLVKLLLFYSCIARLFGMGAGVFTIFIPLLIVIIIYLIVWRKSKT